MRISASTHVRSKSRISPSGGTDGGKRQKQKWLKQEGLEQNTQPHYHCKCWQKIGWWHHRWHSHQTNCQKFHSCKTRPRRKAAPNFEEVEMGSKLKDIRFDALRNAIYHSSRQRFMDTQNRILSFVVVAAGTAAVGDLGSVIGISSKMFAAAGAIAGLLQLVFDLGSKTRTHEFLQRRFYELVARLSEIAETDEALIASAEADLNRLYAEEPPPMRALDAVAYNAASESLGANKRVKIEWYQALLKQWWAFYSAEFPYEETKSIGVART